MHYCASYRRKQCHLMPRCHMPRHPPPQVNSQLVGNTESITHRPFKHNRSVLVVIRPCSSFTVITSQVTAVNYWRTGRLKRPFVTEHPVNSGLALNSCLGNYAR